MQFLCQEAESLFFQEWKTVDILSEETMQAAIEATSSYFARRENVHFACVFGSFADARATTASDLDVAIAGLEPFSLEQKLDFQLELSEQLQREVDVVDLNTSHGAILEAALTKGRQLFCKNPSVRENLLKRMLREHEDDGRFAEKILTERLKLWQS